MKKTAILMISLFLMISCNEKSKETQKLLTVKDVMDHVITRLYEQIPQEKYDSIDDAFMLSFLTDEEKKVLATKYLCFKVNVPVRVSLIRDVNQKVIPFWLEASGFNNTGKKVKNEVYEYEVWQKDFEPGWVNLGIPGFDRDRTIYFITVGVKNKGDELKITDRYPSKYSLEVMKKGAFTYHDWDELKITEFPEELEGDILFTTVRGRAREAHVIGGFRKTEFPSSEKPDQILLTWSKDPVNSIDIQWRTNFAVRDGLVKYWIKGEKDTLTVKAETSVMEDRMLYNDRYVNRHTVHLKDLKGGKEYAYRAGSEKKNIWSDVKDFRTEKEGENKFSFIWFGDTHRAKSWGDVIQLTYKRHPEVAFYSIVGDLVTTGLYRSDWDRFFGYSGDVFAHKPLMPLPGNHDRQDGLGTWMYYQIFSLPKNGPVKVHEESTYAFQYGNALFLMIDSTHPMDDQTEWIEEQLKNTDATWKFVMFHFPPYNFEEPYFNYQKTWVPIFDKYHVDMVMSGHIHYYMRSKPMRNGKVVSSFKDGTVYAISIGTVSRDREIGEEPYAEKRFANGQFYQLMSIDGNKLNFTAYNKEGKVVDEFSIQK